MACLMYDMEMIYIDEYNPWWRLMVTVHPSLSGAERIALLQRQRGTQAPVPRAAEHIDASVAPREGSVRIRGQSGDQLEMFSWSQFIPEPVFWSLRNRHTITLNSWAEQTLLFSAGFWHLDEDERSAAPEEERGLYVGGNGEAFRVALVQFKAGISPDFISCGNQVQRIVITITINNFILELQQCLFQYCFLIDTF